MQVEPPRACRRVGREQIERLQREVVEARGLFERERRGGAFGGTHRVGDRAFGVRRGCRLRVVVREIGQRFLAGRREPLDRLGDLAVQARAAGGGRLRVQRLADERVREGIAARDAGRLLHEASGERLVQDVEQAIFRKIGQRLKDRKVEFAAHDRREAEDAVARLTQARKPAADDLADALRNAELLRSSHVLRLVEACQRARLAEMAQHFTDEERIAFGVLGHRACQRSRALAADPAGDELLDMRLAQSAQSDPDDPLVAPQIRQDLGEWMRAAQLGLAVCRHQAQRRLV